jgi:hypothetical protein
MPPDRNLLIIGHARLSGVTSIVYETMAPSWWRTPTTKDR